MSIDTYKHGDTYEGTCNYCGEPDTTIHVDDDIKDEYSDGNGVVACKNCCEFMRDAQEKTERHEWQEELDRRDEAEEAFMMGDW